MTSDPEMGAAESSVAADTAAPATAMGAVRVSTGSAETSALPGTDAPTAPNRKGPPRRFDHDLCREMYATGEYTKAQLARVFDVSPARIRHIVIPSADRRQAEYTSWYQRQGECETCGAVCTRFYRDGKLAQRCLACHVESASTSVRPDTLRCYQCHRWLPDTEYPHDRNAAILRRGRHGACRQCQTLNRRAYREARKIPCHVCGTPVLHERRNKNKPPECRPCSQARINTKRKQHASKPQQQTVPPTLLATQPLVKQPPPLRRVSHGEYRNARAR